MKRNEHLEPLSHDHFDGLVVVAKIKNALQKDVDRAILSGFIVNFWDSHLSRHFASEEKHLLHVLRELGVEGADRMMEEHRLIKDLVETAMGESGATTGDLSEFADLLQRHIRFEERELFPALETAASADVLAGIGSMLQTDAKGASTVPAAKLEQFGRTVQAACRDAAQRSYVESRTAGLCHEGGFEAAIGAIEMVDVSKLVRRLE